MPQVDDDGHDIDLSGLAVLPADYLAELEEARVDAADLAGELREARKRAATYRAIIKGLAKRVRTFRTAYWRQVDADLERDTDAIAAITAAQATSERYRAERDALQQIVVKAMTERAADRKSRGGAAAIAAFRAATPPAPEQAGDGEQGR